MTLPGGESTIPVPVDLPELFFPKSAPGRKQTLSSAYELTQEFVELFLKSSKIFDSPILGPIREAIQALIAAFPIIGDLVEIFTGIEDGDLNDLGTWVTTLLDGFLDGIPLLSQLVDALTGGTGGLPDLGALADSLAGILGLGGKNNFLDTLDIDDVWSNLITGTINPLGLITALDQALRDLLTGIVDATPTDIDNWLLDLVTGDWLTDTSTGFQGLLNALKGGSGGVISDVIDRLQHLGSGTGILALPGIPNLPTSKITSGEWSLPFLPDLQDVVDGVFQAINGGSSTGNPVSSVKTGLLNIPTLNIFGDWDFTRIVDQASNTLHNWATGLFNAFTGNTTSTSDTSTTNTQMAQMVSTVASIASRISAVESIQLGGNNSGISGNDDFERTASSNLGGSSYWAETYLSGTSSNGYMAIVDGHQAAWVTAGTAAREGRFRCTDPAFATTNTSYQRINFVIGTQVAATNTGTGTSAFTKIYCRMNAAETQYVFARIRADSTATVAYAQFGYANGGSETLVGSEVLVNQSAGATWALDAGTLAGVREFVLYYNGAQKHTWSDSGALSAEGTSNLGWGWGAGAQANASGQLKPNSVTRVTVADNIPPTITGSGARIYRNTISSAATASVGENKFPTNWYTSTSYASSDITVDLTNGKFTAEFTGFYLCSICVQVTNAPSTTSQIAMALFKNGSLFEYDGTSILTTTVVPFFIKGLFQVFLAAGDYVEAGYYLSTGSITGAFIGGSAGTATYFDIALLSRSTL